MWIGALNLHAEASATNHLCPERQSSKHLKLSSTSHEDWERGRNVGTPFLPLTFDTTRTPEVSALGAGSNLTPRKCLSAHFWYRLSGLQGY
jgi:hypothetical protein